jgi:hypothetical protein
VCMRTAVATDIVQLREDMLIESVRLQETIIEDSRPPRSDIVLFASQMRKVNKPSKRDS